jgi:hypothetical protein
MDAMRNEYKDDLSRVGTIIIKLQDPKGFKYRGHLNAHQDSGAGL